MSPALSPATRWLLSLPGLIAGAVLVGFPVAILVWLSAMQRHTYEASGQFAGLQNYFQLAADREFWNSVWLTAEYTVMTVSLQVIIGLLGALALVRFRRAAAPLLALMLLPYVLPTVLVAFVWRWMLDPSIGFVNVWGSILGVIPRDFGWFTKTHILATLVFVGAWQFFPFALLLLYAKLVSIPRARYEAAAADGYSPLQSLFRVTMPELVPVTTTVVLLRGLFMATKFDAVWLLGGQEAVGKWIQTLPVMAYRVTFEAQNAGLGAAVSVMLLAVLMAIACIATGVMYVRRSTS